MSGQTTGVDNRFDVRPTAGNHFAWINTRLAIERTFLAWIRTAIALIGFGFTIVQFFQRLQSMGNAPVRAPGAPRDLGTALIATGIGALVVAMIQYHWGTSYMWKSFPGLAGFGRPRIGTPAYFCAIVLMCIGIAALVSVFVRFP